MEFQKRGAIHYHVLLFNWEFVEKKVLEEIWGLGFIKLIPYNEQDNLAKYLTKYFTKGAGDERLDGKKRYFCSKNLKRPQIINQEKKVLDIITRIPKQYGTAIEPYESIHHGKVSCIEYDFGKGKTVFDIVDLSPNEDYGAKT